MKKLKIIHLYPAEMNIYGDNGNLLILRQRLGWRGIEADIVPIGIGDNIPHDSSLIVGGGGQDAGQALIAEDLARKKKDLVHLADSGLPMLMICGIYQMFGRYFKTQEGHELQGLGILDVETIASDKRLIGNIVVQSEFGELIGYENHSGLTYLKGETKALGKTSIGQGNNLTDGQEGARYKNVFASYLHGPILSKAPQFADYLLQLALEHSGNRIKLKDLKKIDNISNQAAQIARLRKR